MAHDKPNNHQEEQSLKDLWKVLPANIKRFAVILLIILVCSASFVIFYFSDAVGELVYMSQQIGNITE